MSQVTKIKPAYFLGQPNLTNPKVLGSKVEEIIEALNEVVTSTDGALKADSVAEFTSGSGVTLTSQRKPVTSTVALTKALSGSTVVLATLAGDAVTLPAAVVGLNYTFARTASLTSATSTITTNGTDVFKGAIFMKKDATADKVYTTTTATTITETFTTVTGGLVGGTITVTCIATGVWALLGSLIYSGTVANPLS